MTPENLKTFEQLLSVARKYGCLSAKVGDVEFVLDPRQAAPESVVKDGLPQLTPEMIAELRKKSVDGLLEHERADLYASSGS